MTALPNYKGYQIEVDENGTFKATSQSREEGIQGVAQADSLVELKKKLDKITKAAISGKFAVWIKSDSWRHDSKRFVLGKVTSVTNKQGYSGSHNEFRVTWKNRDENTEWEDLGAAELIKDTESNRKLMEHYREQVALIEKAETEKEETMKKMTCYTEKELMGDSLGKETKQE